MSAIAASISSSLAAKKVSSINGKSISSFAKLPSLSSCRSIRRSVFTVKAAEESSSTVDTQKLVDDLKEKWDKVEDKPAVALYAGGGVLAIWLASAIVGAISSIPLLPKVLELVGVGYSGWFVYRYLLFKSSRKELAAEIEELKSKITGTKEE